MSELKQIIELLRDAEMDAELDCSVNDLRPVLLDAANLIESQNNRIIELECQLAESKAREKAMLGQLCAIKDCHTCIYYIRDCGLDIECKRPACNWWKLYYEYRGVSEKGE